MRLLLKVNSSNEYDDEIDTGFISVDRQLAEIILKRRKVMLTAAEFDGSLLRMDYYDEAFVYLSDPELDKEKKDDLREELDDGVIFPVEDDYSKRKEVVEMDSQYMRIFREGVCFFGYQKYSVTEYYSEAIPYNEIEKAL